MANTIKLKRGSGSNPSASDLSVGEVALRTDGNPKLFTKNDDGNVLQVNLVESGSITSTQILDGTIVNADINASAAIAGTKISPDFGSQDITGSKLTINSTTPIIDLAESDGNPDYRIFAESGAFVIRNQSSIANRFVINSDGHIDLKTNVDCEAGLDVTGDINCTSDLILDSTNTDYPRITLHSNATGIRKYAIINGQGWNQDALLIYDVDGDNTRLTIEPNGLGINRGANSISHGLDVGGTAIIRGNSEIQGNLDIADGTLIIDTTPDSPNTSYGLQEAIRIDDAGNTADRGLSFYEYRQGGGRFFSLNYNLASGSTGSAYTYTQGNYAGSTMLRFDGTYKFFVDSQVTSGSTDVITPTKRFEITSSGVDVTGNITATGTIGSSNITITNSQPFLSLQDSDNENDFEVGNAGGLFRIRDVDAAVNRFTISSAGVTTIAGNLDVGAGIDCTGTIKIGSNTTIFESNSNATAVIQHADIHHAIIFRGTTNANGSTITQGNTTTFREYGDFVFRTGQINAQERFIIESGGTCKFVNNVEGSADEDMAKFIPNGSVELYEDGSIKLTTSSTGVTVTGTCTATTFSGSGASLTNIPAGQLTGTLPALDGSNLTGVVASGSNASTLDNLDSTQFLRSDTSDTINGFLTVGGSSVSANEGGELRLTHAPNGSLSGNEVKVDVFNNLFRIFEGGGNARGFRLDITQANNNSNTKIWHEGNDGSGSGLDSDTLDGIEASSFLRSDANDSWSGVLTNNSRNEDPSVTTGAINLQPSSSGGSTGIIFRSKINASSDFGYLWFFDDLNAYRTSGDSSENGVLLLGIQNDAANAISSDTIAIESSGDIFLNPGIGTGKKGVNSHNSSIGNLYVGNAATKYKVFHAGAHALPAADSTYNLGANGTRWANIYGDQLYGAGSNITSLNASNISSGTVAAARLPNHSATLLTSGTLPPARLPNHSAALLTSGTVAAARLDTASTSEAGISVVGNFGQWQVHNTYSDFNTEPAYWGWNYVMGNTNAPNTQSSQWYRCRLSLGSQYGKGSASGDYSLEMAIPRSSQASAGVLHVRGIENGNEGAWVSAGFPSGTRMIFQQTSAPTGWTKDTTDTNQRALRVVSGSVGSGGNTDFTSAFASRGVSGTIADTTQGGSIADGGNNTNNASISTNNGGNNTNNGGNNTNSSSISISVNNHTLSTAQMPSHTHTGRAANHDTNSAASQGYPAGNNHQRHRTTDRAQNNNMASTSHLNTGSTNSHNHGLSQSSHSHSINSHSHSINQHSHSIPDHSHSISNHGHSFTGSAHNHSFSGTSINMAVRYLDVIIAQKD